MPPRVRLPQELAELTACWSSAHDQQQNLKTQLKKLRRREQRARARTRTSWLDMITFGVMVVAIVGADFTWVPNLLSRFQQTANPKDVEDEIGKRFLELPAEELRAMLEQTGPASAKRPFHQAQEFATQFAVWNWVDEQNRGEGLAPSVADVIKQRNLQLDAAQSGVWGEFTTTSSRRPAACYKWVARWKRNWNLAFGKTSEHEVLPTEDVRTKALKGKIRHPN